MPNQRGPVFKTLPETNKKISQNYDECTDFLLFCLVINKLGLINYEFF